MINALQRFYSGMNNVVLRDASQRPSVFVKHYKQTSQSLDSRLPNHTHPAFIYTDSEGQEVEDPYILIGKYLNSDIGNDKLYSLPNAEVAMVVNSRLSVDYNTIVSKLRGEFSTVTGMTVADHGLLMLLAHKNNWVSHGNNRSGCDYRQGEGWSPAITYKTGNLVIHKGYRWKCTINSSLNQQPPVSPGSWEKIEKIGGTMDSQGKFTLTGSGPVNWYLLSDPELESDVQGQGDCILYGIRLVDGQIQILPNNVAGDSSTNISPQSNNTLWKAILPGYDNSTNRNYTLVTPGTAGTMHIVTESGSSTSKPIYIVDRILTEAELRYTRTQVDFKSIQVQMSSSSLQVPSIIYQLGIAPLSGTSIDGTVWLPQYQTSSGTTLSHPIFIFTVNRNSTQARGAGLGGMRIFPYTVSLADSGGYMMSRSRSRATT